MNLIFICCSGFTTKFYSKCGCGVVSQVVDFQGKGLHDCHGIPCIGMELDDVRTFESKLQEETNKKVLEGVELQDESA